MDLQFIQFSDALELTGVRPLYDFSPPTLELHGQDLRSAIEVYINDIKSPSFVIMDKNRILVQIPEQLAHQTLNSITVLSSEFTATIRSQLRFRLSSNPKKATGLKALIQTFLKVLFTTPGTDAFAKRLGGAGLRGVGQNIDLSNTTGLLADFAIAVSRAESQVRALQSYQPRLPDEERLLSASLVNIKFDPAATALVARLELVAQSGARAITNLEL